MVDQEKYKKLRAANGASLVSRHSLWIGSDHLLSVTYTYGTEDYRRYYFSEIQAFVVHRTADWAVGNWILGVAMALFLIPALILLPGSTGANIPLFITAGAFGCILLGYLISGPTGKIYIQTATSFDQIRGVSRLFRIRKIMRRLEPLVREAQQEQGTTGPVTAPSAGPGVTLPPG